MTVLRADGKKISLWSGPGAEYGRYDYRSEHHRLSDILTNDYFGAEAHMFKVGDFITLIDCEDQILTVRVDHVERATMKVYLSKIERLYAMPVVAIDPNFENDPGLCWRWRARNGGGHTIMTAKGEIVAINFISKEVAEQQIRIMYETKKIVAPSGHEPTREYVKDSPIYRPI